MLLVQKLSRVGTLKLLQLLLLFLLVFVQPYDTRVVRLDDIHFVVGAVLGLLDVSTRIFDIVGDACAIFLTVLRIITTHILKTSLSEFVFETGFKTLVQVVVGRIFLDGKEVFSLVQDLADQYPVDAYASLSSKIHNA